MEDYIETHRLFQEFINARTYQELRELWADDYFTNMLALAKSEYAQDVTENDACKSDMRGSDREWKIAYHYDDIHAWANGRMSTKELGGKLGVSKNATPSILSNWRRNSDWEIPRKADMYRRRSYHDVYDALVRFKQDNQGNSPTIVELADMIGMSTTATYTRLQQLAETDLIEIDGHSRYILVGYSFSLEKQ